MGSMGAGDLRLRTSLPGQRPGNIVWRGRQCPKLRMNFGIVVKTARETAQLSAFNQTGEGLIDRSTCCHVEKVGGREDTAASSTPGASHNSIGN